MAFRPPWRPRSYAQERPYYIKYSILLDLDPIRILYAANSMRPSLFRCIPDSPAPSETFGFLQAISTSPDVGCLLSLYVGMNISQCAVFHSVTDYNSHRSMWGRRGEKNRNRLFLSNLSLSCKSLLLLELHISGSKLHFRPPRSLGSDLRIQDHTLDT